MLSYRNLVEDDCEFILQNWVEHSVIFRKGLGKDELLSMIKSINTKQYDGNYYEMFGLLNDNILIGTFSLYQRECDIPENAVYFGVEIDKNKRMKGFATNAAFMVFKIAKERGYEKIFSQARTDNLASVRMHEKCGFHITQKTINKKGNEVYNFSKIL